jgi:long-subunit fatty acid transport protein
VPALITFQYDAKLPSSWQWQGGVQMTLPWAMALDVSYVGNHGFNRLRAFQGGANGAVDLTRSTSVRRSCRRTRIRRSGPNSVPARARIRRVCCAPSAGEQRQRPETRYWDEYTASRCR